jgi:hypothetical protein
MFIKPEYKFFSEFPGWEKMPSFIKEIIIKQDRNKILENSCDLYVGGKLRYQGL